MWCVLTNAVYSSSSWLFDLLQMAGHTHTSAWNWHAVKGHFFGAAKAISAAVSRACSRSNIRRHVHWMLWHLLQGQGKGATRSAMHSIWFNTWTKFQNIFKLFSCLNYPRYFLLLLWTDTDHNFDIAHPDSWKKAQCNQSTILVNSMDPYLEVS
jgi:hypothetical protein